jgi:hypothetical protein
MKFLLIGKQVNYNGEISNLNQAEGFDNGIIINWKATSLSQKFNLLRFKTGVLLVYL